jgi:hypothetical protein
MLRDASQTAPLLLVAMQATALQRSGHAGLFLFDGHFGCLDDRENRVALFEIHSLH